MLDIDKMRFIEERGRDGRAISRRTANLRVAVLFIVVVLGILASWFWDVGWKYLAAPEQGLNVGPVLAVIVRVILSFIAAAITFVSVYTKIDQNTEESWIPYFVAFQNGFFWDALFQSVAASLNR